MPHFSGFLVFGYFASEFGLYEELCRRKSIEIITTSITNVKTTKEAGQYIKKK